MRPGLAGASHARFGDFARDLASLLGGAGVGQLVTLLATPAITRLYAPSEIAPAAFLLALLAVFAPVAALRYDKAIVLPARDAESRALVRLALGCALGSALLAALLLVASAPWHAELADLRELGGWIHVLPLGIVVFALGRIASESASRERAYAALGQSRVAAALGMAATRIGAGLAFGGTLGGYLLGAFAGEALRSARLWPSGVASALRPLAGSTFAAQRGELAAAARAYRDFPRLSMPTTFLNRFSENLPVLMLGVIYGASAPAVGLFALTNRSLRSPIDAASEALRRLVLQRTAALHNAGQPLGGFFVRLTLGLALLALPPLLLVWSFGEPVFAWVFGPEWAQAGQYAAVLVPWLFTTVLISPANAVFHVARRLGLWLGLQVLATLTRLGVFAAGVLAGWGPLPLLAAFAWVCFAVNALAIGWAFVLASRLAPGSGSGPDLLDLA